jgi:hypothetical protein
MRKPNLVLCQGASIPEAVKPKSVRILKLALEGPCKNIELRVEDVVRKLAADLPAQFIDLLEIASYVYSADQNIRRGGPAFQDNGSAWYRDIHIVIPVRAVSVWRDTKVSQQLTSTLNFLSGDIWEFTFVQRDVVLPAEQYFRFGPEELGLMPEEAVLFSGGLDSLARAIDAILNRKKSVVLVSHRSVPKTYTRQKELVGMLRKAAPKPECVYHVPVWVHNVGKEAIERTQRSRSFLYVALGYVVARMFKLDSLSLSDNGVVSMNLFPAEQIVDTRATRSTHPRVIRDFTKLLSVLEHSEFTVRNDFEYKTKTDVVRLIKDGGQEDLIKHTGSCSHVYGTTKLQTHCGTCMQCLNRRFGIIAAGCEDYDPIEMYKCDIFVDEIEKGEPRVSTESFYLQALEMSEMSDAAFVEKYATEISRIVGGSDSDPEEGVSRVLDLYRRHAAETLDVVKRQISLRSEELLHHRLPQHSLVKMAVGGSAEESVSPGGSLKEETTPDQRIFQYQKKGRVWEIIYDGTIVGFFDDIDGHRYVHKLLQEPGRDFWAIDLYDEVSGQQAGSSDLSQIASDSEELAGQGLSIKRDLGRGKRILYQETLQGYNEEMIRLKNDYEIAKDTGNTARMTQLGEQLIELEQGKKKISTSKGNPKRGQTLHKLRRDTIKKAIDRVYEILRESCAELAEHLEASIKTRGRFSYQPSTHINWQL